MEYKPKSKSKEQTDSANMIIDKINTPLKASLTKSIPSTLRLKNNDWIQTCPKHFDHCLTVFIKDTELASPNNSFPYTFYKPIDIKFKDYFFSICEKELLSPFTKYLAFHLFQKAIQNLLGYIYIYIYILSAI